MNQSAILSSSHSTFAQQMMSCFESTNSTGNLTGPSCLLSILSSGDFYHNTHPFHDTVLDPNPSSVGSLNATNSTSLSTSLSYSSDLLLIRDAVRFWVQRIIVPLVTVIGLFGNLLTIVVMCQRRMSTSSTHIYLAALALSDALYLTFVFLLSLVHYPAIKTDLSVMKMIYWHSYSALIFGCDCASNTAIWLTVCFTIERYIVIRYPIKGKVLCTTSRAIKVILCVGLTCFLITIPTFFEWKIVFTEPPDQTNSTISSFEPSILIENTDLGTNAIYRSIYYWFTVIVFVFVPLTILTIFNLFLIRSVRKSSQKRRQWITDQQPSSFSKPASPPVVISGSLIHPASPCFNPKPKSRSLMRFVTSARIKPPVECPTKVALPNPFTPTYRILLRQDAHITRLLIAVVLFFLICQLPSALVIIYTASIGSDQSSNQQAVLTTLGNIFNLLVAINSAGNFTLYCLLSRKYRRTLLELIMRLTTIKH